MALAWGLSSAWGMLEATLGVASGISMAIGWEAAVFCAGVCSSFPDILPLSTEILYSTVCSNPEPELKDCSGRGQIHGCAKRSCEEHGVKFDLPRQKLAISTATVKVE